MVKRPFPFLFAVILAIAAAFPAALTAQVRASELAGAWQVVDGTKIAIEYSRPKVRGRENLFGGILWWGHIWTPGANWASTFEIDKDVKVNGHDLPAGTYSMWMILDEGDWEMVFHDEERLFHLPEPELPADDVRFMVTPEYGADHVEVLTFDFVDVEPSGATVEMRWADVRVPLHIEVAPSRDYTVAADVAAPYLGRYEVEWYGDMAEGDFFQNLVLTHEGGSMKGDWKNAWPGYSDEFLFLTVAEDWFNPAMTEGGKMYDVWDWATVEFLRDGDAVTGFEVRFTDDTVIGRAKKIG